MAAFLTHTGKRIVTGKLKASGTEPLNLGWGTGTGVLASDVALLAPASEARVTGTSSITTTTRPGDTYTVVGTIVANAPKTIQEVALFDSSATAPSTTLAAGGVVGSSVSTTLNLASATGFPGSGNYYLQVESEIMLVTAGQGTTALTVTRAQLGSTAVATHAVGNVVTAGAGGGDAAVTATVTGGSIFAHADHGANAINAADSITYTANTQLT